MPSLTKQITRNTGQDTSSSSRNQSVSSSSSQQTQPTTTTQSTVEGGLVTTQVNAPSTQSTEERADAQVAATTEDHAFTLNVSIPLKGALPCEEIPI